MQANLDRQTIYDLILSHGRTEVFLHYATVVGDYHRVVEHWVLEEKWDKVIDVLNRQVRVLYSMSGNQLTNNCIYCD